VEGLTDPGNIREVDFHISLIVSSRPSVCVCVDIRASSEIFVDVDVQARSAQSDASGTTINIA
jgi:hypothetical protein